MATRYLSSRGGHHDQNASFTQSHPHAPGLYIPQRSFEEVVITGLASDGSAQLFHVTVYLHSWLMCPGGLFLPQDIPAIPAIWEGLWTQWYCF